MLQFLNLILHLNKAIPVMQQPLYLLRVRAFRLAFIFQVKKMLPLQFRLSCGQVIIHLTYGCRRIVQKKLPVRGMRGIQYHFS